jgi:LPXTG-motif cell wall-anchored protein
MAGRTDVTMASQPTTVGDDPRGDGVRAVSGPDVEEPSFMGHTHHRSVRMLVVLAATVVAMLSLSVSAAFAQYPPGLDFGVTCIPENPSVGQTPVCTVVGAAAGETLAVTATVGDQVIHEATITADANGDASFSFEVPLTAAGAAISVTVTGEQSGTAAATLQVQQATDGSTDDGTDDGSTVDDTDGDSSAPGETQRTAVTQDTAAATTSTSDNLPRTGLETVTLVLAGLLLLGLGVTAVVASRRRTRRRVDA